MRRPRLREPGARRRVADSPLARYRLNARLHGRSARQVSSCAVVPTRRAPPAGGTSSRTLPSSLLSVTSSATPRREPASSATSCALVRSSCVEPGCDDPRPLTRRRPPLTPQKASTDCSQRAAASGVADELLTPPQGGRRPHLGARLIVAVDSQHERRDPTGDHQQLPTSQPRRHPARSRSSLRDRNAPARTASQPPPAPFRAENTLAKNVTNLHSKMAHLWPRIRLEDRHRRCRLRYAQPADAPEAASPGGRGRATRLVRLEPSRLNRDPVERPPVPIDKGHSDSPCKIC